MKAIMKTRSSLALITMFVTIGLGGPAAAQKGVPFHGTLQGVETDVAEFPTLFVDGSGTGIATHLGRFTVTWEATVNLVTGSGSGVFHFIAANGDSIFTEDLGQAEPTDPPGVFQIVEINTITGGTGRFEGATGSFTLERLSDSTGLSGRNLRN
jgi:hypothetical protein